MEDDQTTTDAAPVNVPTTGMTMVQDAVTFTNKQVLEPQATPIKGTAKMMADQAAAMMIEDVRSYLQGSEQILTMATGQALAQILAGNESTGEKTIEMVIAVQMALPKFAAAIGTTATKIASDFV